MDNYKQKALYFCHTHPNLFLQKKCKSCKRGMCHTCIYNNPEFCTDCLSRQRRFSVNYQNKKDITTTLISSLAIGTIITILIVYKGYNIGTYSISQVFLISFFGALSVISCYFMMRETEIFSSVGRIPFIGFKLSIVLMVLILITGVPILYMLYKTILLLKSGYFKQS